MPRSKKTTIGKSKRPASLKTTVVKKKKKTAKQTSTLLSHLKIADQNLILNNVLETNPLAVIITDHQGTIEYINPVFTRMTGYALEDVKLKDIKYLIKRSHGFSLYKQIWNIIRNTKDVSNEFQARRKNGETSWHTVTIKTIKNKKNEPRHYIAFLEDISDQKQSEKTIEHMSFYDQLTDLPNRAMFNSRLQLALKQAHRTGEKLAVVLLDLDRFKVINDTLGHTVGDELIKLVGLRLHARLRETDTIARMGGDEFMMLLPNIADFKDAFKIIQKIMEVFTLPFEYDGNELHIKSSMGITLFPEDGEDAMALLKNADSALYEAKNSGRNHYKFYTAKLNASAFEQLTLENALRQALEKDQFTVYYQPQINLDTGKVVGMEALVRWNHPEMGLVPPLEFIPLAEETGLIVPLGLWVLRTACMQTLEWHKQGFDNLRIAVNLSTRQFQEPELVESVLGICQETGLNPKYLELEITESILMKDITIAIMILRWLNKKGIRIAIDDFGTGYSSLAYLKKFPINNLKIDRSFIRECLTNTDDAAIVTTISSIAHNLKIQIIAEGVETEGQLQFIKSLGCDEIQGYYFSPPLPSEDFTKLLTDGKSIPLDIINGGNF